MGNENKTITFSLEPLTDGYPALVNAAFRAGVAKAAAGGQQTQDYFDAVNATSDFWQMLAKGMITFADGVDPHGNKVLMASSGNVELRVAAAYAGDGGQGEHPPFGIVTIDTHNATTDAAAGMAVLARLGTMPVFLPLSTDLFYKLLVPMFSNVKTFLGNTASALARACSSGVPDINAGSLAGDIVGEQSAVVEDVEGLVEEGIEYMGIEWADIALDAAGLAPLMAIPMIIEFLGHEMTHSLIVQNMSGVDFTFELTQIWGKTTFKPGTDKLPKTETKADPLDKDKQVQYSYSANYHFINTTNLGPIGYVLVLRPSDGSPATHLLVSVPWAGDNAIWAGTWNGSPQGLWDRESKPNQKLQVTTESGGHKVTLSLNALAGTTEGGYFYCSMALIE